MDTVNEKLFSAVVRHDVEILRLAAGTSQWVIKELNSSDNEIYTAIQEYGPDGPVHNIDKLLGEVLRINTRAYRGIEKELTSQLKELVRYEADFHQSLLEDTLPIDLSVVKPRVGQLNAIVTEEPMHGGLLSEWVSGMADGRYTRIRQAIRQGAYSGEDAEQIIRRIRGRRALQYKDGALQRSRTSVDRTVSSLVSHVAMKARATVYGENDELIEGMQWTAILDQWTCDQCKALDQQVFPVLNASVDGQTVVVLDPSLGSGPPIHFNCLPGDCLVTSRDGVSAYTKRAYEGELVFIRTASGRELRCTPNHPILTDRGWVAAKLLDQSSNVVCDGGVEWVHGRSDQNIDHVPTPIEKVAETFARTGYKRLLPITAADFHGDGIADSQVAVVWADSLLADSFDIAKLQQISQFYFIVRPVSYQDLARQSAGGFSSHRVFPSAARLMSGSGLVETLSCGHFRPFNDLLLTGRTARNIGLLQHTLDSFASHIETPSQSHDGLPSFVGAHYRPFLDRVVEKSSSRVANIHVYNLQTGSGYFTAGGIITHNCRCGLVPVVSAAEDLPVDVDSNVAAQLNGKPAPRLSYQQWLRQQSKDFQDEVLGPEKARMFRRGLTVENFVDHSGRKYTLPELRKREAKLQQRQAAFVMPQRRNYGWKPDVPDQQDLLYAVEHPEDIALAVRTSLRTQMPPIFDQGGLGSCTGEALIAAVMFAHGPQTPMLSVLDLYYKERVIEGTINEDSGAEIRDGMKALKRWGVCTEKTWPYKIRAFKQKPPPAAQAEDDEYRIVKYMRLKSHEDFMRCLASGYPFVIGFSVYENFDGDTVEKNGILIMPTIDQRRIGAHAVCIIGYDSDFHNNQVFKASGLQTSQVPALMYEVRNSFGPAWGDQGNFWIPAPYLENRDLADDAWCIRVVT